MGRPTQIWEQQARETARAFAAFCAFRDMPPAERSIDGAWKSTPQNAPKCSSARRSANWNEWAFNNDWKIRCVAFDAEQDRKRIAAIDAAQRAEIQTFRAQLRKDNKTFADAARISLSKAIESLQKLSNEKLSARDAAALLNAASAAIKTANEMQAQGLGLDEVTRILEADGNLDNDLAGEAGTGDTATG